MFMTLMSVPDFVSGRRLLTLPGELLSSRDESNQRREKGETSAVSPFLSLSLWAKFEDKHRLTADTFVSTGFPVRGAPP
jgi:hypothetical protein